MASSRLVPPLYGFNPAPKPPEKYPGKPLDYMRQVVDHGHCLSPTKTLIMNTMARMVNNETGSQAMTIAAIAYKSHLSWNTVQTNLPELCRDGWVRIFRRRRAGSKRFLPNEYVLLMPWHGPGSPCKACGEALRKAALDLARREDADVEVTEVVPVSSSQADPYPSDGSSRTHQMGTGRPKKRVRVDPANGSCMLSGSAGSTASDPCSTTPYPQQPPQGAVGSGASPVVTDLGAAVAEQGTSSQAGQADPEANEEGRGGDPEPQSPHPTATPALQASQSHATCTRCGCNMPEDTSEDICADCYWTVMGAPTEQEPIALLAPEPVKAPVDQTEGYLQVIRRSAQEARCEEPTLATRSAVAATNTVSDPVATPVQTPPTKTVSARRPVASRKRQPALLATGVATAPQNAPTPAHKRYAESYGAGVAETSGQPFPPPRNGKQDFIDMATYYAKGGDGTPLKGDGLLGWFRKVGGDYWRATQAVAQYQAGFAPYKCLQWLKAGRPASRGPGSGGGGFLAKSNSGGIPSDRESFGVTEEQQRRDAEYGRTQFMNQRLKNGKTRQQDFDERPMGAPIDDMFDLE